MNKYDESEVTRVNAKDLNGKNNVGFSFNLLKIPIFNKLLCKIIGEDASLISKNKE